MYRTVSQTSQDRIGFDLDRFALGRHSSPPRAVCEVRQRLVLALLRPPIPRLESIPIKDLLGARDVVLYIVVQEVLAAFIADATCTSPDAPPGTVDLKDAMRIAGGCLWTS